MRMGRGTYPRGYGLPSLVVILFLTSVLISSITQVISRETVEARAAAAFNGVEERLNAFEITGTDGTGLFSHVPGSRDVTVTMTGGGAAPNVRVETAFRSNAERVLFEQQLRAFLNVPNAAPIGPVRPAELRRKHPERVLRSGDRMGAPISMRDLPSPAASVRGAGTVLSGAGAVSETAAAGQAIGFEDSLFEAPLLSGPELSAEVIEASRMLIGATGTVSGTLVSGSARSDITQVGGLLRVRSGTAFDLRASGPFATETLENNEEIHFGTIRAAGVRAEGLKANRLTFEELSGPAPGALPDPVPVLTPDQVLRGRE
jgi:hypothetical protein